MTQTNTPVTAGVHHVGLTVPNIAATSRFFIDRLGFSVVGEKPAYPAVFVSDASTMITLWQVREGSEPRNFDRHAAVGLHHLALKVRDRETLDTLAAALATDDEVEIEFMPEPLGTSGLAHMMCYAPGGVRLELVA
jgi:catechol 2,3-dioxygenase-like lactoylglutathione lyase family enzyme